MRGVKDLSQVAKRALLVEHLVSFRELVTVVSWGALRLEVVAKAFDLI